MNIARGFLSLEEKHKQENTRKGDYKTHQVQSLLSFSWCNFTSPLGFTTHTTTMKWLVCMPSVPTAVYFESTSTLKSTFPLCQSLHYSCQQFCQKRVFLLEYSIQHPQNAVFLSFKYLQVLLLFYSRFFTYIN